MILLYLLLTTYILAVNFLAFRLLKAQRDGVDAGDEACIFGAPGCDTIEDVARKAGTIPYEVMCALALRVPRVYLRGGEAVALADYLNQTSF